MKTTALKKVCFHSTVHHLTEWVHLVKLTSLAVATLTMMALVAVHFFGGE